MSDNDAPFRNELLFRVRYSETDQMGTFYNSRALEWFEVGRTEVLRDAGIPYARMEQRGVGLPLVEARVRYLGRARYDDRLRMRTRLMREGRARLRFEIDIAHADSGDPVAAGYTVHAITDADGRPIRPPSWLVETLEKLGPLAADKSTRDRGPAPRS